MGKYNLGDRVMSYLMQPCGINGNPINGGNHYANDDDLDGARSWAQQILSAPDSRHLGYVVRSVSISGGLQELGHGGWKEVRGVRGHYEVVHSTQPYPYTATDLTKRCYPSTALDVYELVHEKRSDGTCACGDPTRTVPA